MVIAGFSSWFDWHGIDGVVDGVARGVKNTGGRVRKLQSGRLQYSIYYAIFIVALALAAYVIS